MLQAHKIYWGNNPEMSFQIFGENKVWHGASLS